MQRNATQYNGRASRPPPMTSRRNEPMASLRHRPRCSLGAEPISCRNGAAESCAGGGAAMAERKGRGAQGSTAWWRTLRFQQELRSVPTCSACRLLALRGGRGCRLSDVGYCSSATWRSCDCWVCADITPRWMEPKPGTL